MSELVAKVTAYKEHLIIDTVKPEKTENFIPVGNGRIGCVLINTDKLLGMSKEAFSLMKKLKVNGDAIGDISTWKTTDERNCFSWVGGLKRLVDVKNCECSRDGIIDIEHIIIENEVPEEAKTVIDQAL